MPSMDQYTYDVVVIGASIQDFTSYAARIPNAGEIIYGTHFAMSFGGKGANQAVMAARLGARTAMISKVGNDQFGHAILDNFKSNGINVDEVGISESADTDTCSVVVNDSGEYRLMGVLGSTTEISINDILKAESKISNAKVIICTLEIHETVVKEALKLAKKHNVTTLLNPSPRFLNNLPNEFYEYSDIICANKLEVEWMTKMALQVPNDYRLASDLILDRGAGCIIITLGEDGCQFSTKLERELVDIGAPKVDVLDTTGAGDAFIGSIAYFTACRMELPFKEHVKRSCHIATSTVTAPGAQTSYPSRDQIPGDIEFDMASYDIVNVGSIVQDFISYVPRFPKPGETVCGHKFVYNFGGKGANQAVMAARLGAKAAMVGKVGRDLFGQAMIENFHANEVNADHVTITDETHTGSASIRVDDSGQNSIAVCVGANLFLTAEDIRRAEPILSKAKVVVCQLEVTEEASLETLKIAKKHGVTTIFNPAPDPPNGIQDDQFYKNADIICPNQHEVECLAGFPVKTHDDQERALALFLNRGAKIAIVTLGEQGCVFATRDNPKPVRIGAPKVKAVDATGAGDAFVGALSYYTACRNDLPLEERIRRSINIAAISVQSAGTQSSYPTRDLLPKNLLA